MKLSANLLQSLLTLGLVVSLGVAIRGCADAKAEAGSKADQYAVQRRINDSTTAQLATARSRLTEYAGLLKAAHQIDGKLIAAAKVRVEARDTVVVHDTVPTLVLADSTRIATFTDSTFAGVIHDSVTAPPCCQPLSVTHRTHRPAFEPSVGFVQTPDNRVVAVVTWQGERAEIASKPFARIPAPQKRFSPYAEVLTDPKTVWTIAGGASLRAFWGLELTARTEARFEACQVGEDCDRVRLGVGFRKEW